LRRSWCAWPSVLLRAGRLARGGALLERGDRRKRLALDELEEGAAAGRDVGNVVPDAFSMAASVSPPPAIENAGLFAMASARVRVPPPNWSNSNTPSGPFQMTVPAAATTAATARAESGPMSRIISSAATADAGFVSAFAVGANSRATTTSVGIGMPTPRALACASRRLATSIMSGSCSDLPTDAPSAARKVFAIPPPTTSWSTFEMRLSSTSSLVETFEPPTTATSGRRGFPRARASASSSAASSGPAQATGAASATPCVLASARCGVHHEDVAERRHARRERGVVLLLALQETHVLEQHDFPGRGGCRVELIVVQAHGHAE
jgi:hypothetical protein